MDIRPIETFYNGYRFRSRLEARWAVFFDAAGIPYEYEHEGYVLGNGMPYLPDFYLPWFKAFVEVKPNNIDFDEQCAAETKCFNLIADKSGNIALLCKGDPVEMDVTIFCGIYDDTLHRPVPHIDKAIFVEGVWFLEEDRDDGCPILCGHSKHWIDIAVGSETDDEFRQYFPEALLIQRSMITEYRSQLEPYRQRGRQARFEHGETPIVRK